MTKQQMWKLKPGDKVLVKPDSGRNLVGGMQNHNGKILTVNHLDDDGDAWFLEIAGFAAWWEVQEVLTPQQFSAIQQQLVNILAL